MIDKPSKKLTEAQFRFASEKAGIEYAALRAVNQVECKGRGFNGDEPVILFERHVFFERLNEHGLLNTARRAYSERPDLCNPKATPSGGYGLESAQHGRLQAAALYDRTSALESASWGIGQVMGYNWADLGYPSLQAFMNAMYKDEASQLDAMIRYIQHKNLIDELNRHEWAKFAKVYNGSGYAKFHYDSNLAKAYKLFATP